MRVELTQRRSQRRCPRAARSSGVIMWDVQATAVTMCSSPHRGTSSHTSMRAGLRPLSGGSVVRCAARVTARYAMRLTLRNAGRGQPPDRKWRGTPACVSDVSAVSPFPLVMRGTLFPLLYGHLHSLLPDERTLSCTEM